MTKRKKHSSFVNALVKHDKEYPLSPKEIRKIMTQAFNIIKKEFHRKKDIRSISKRPAVYWGTRRKYCSGTACPLPYPGKITISPECKYREKTIGVLIHELAHIISFRIFHKLGHDKYFKDTLYCLKEIKRRPY